MKKAGKYIAQKQKKRGKRLLGVTILAWVLMILLVVSLVLLPNRNDNSAAGIPAAPPATQPVNDTEPTTQPTEPVDPTAAWEMGYIAARSNDAAYYDGDGALLGTLPRGTQVKYETGAEGITQILFDGVIRYLGEEAAIVSDPADIIPAHGLYVKTAVNLRDIDGKLLDMFASKGQTVDVNGCDYFTKMAAYICIA